MAYTNQDIESKARGMLAGNIGPNGAKLLRSVCSAAATELEARLRKGVKSSDIEELFVTAAGMLAISMYLELDNSAESGVDSFSAGSLSVNLRDGAKVESAAILRKRAENLLAAYLECGGFAFSGVEG